MIINRAFCIELQREVDMFTARQEFFSQKNKKKFNFLCSDEDCKSLDEPVQIVGVLHNRDPKVENAKRSPHFRTFKGQKHTQNCEYVELESALNKFSTTNDIAKEILFFKNTGLITRFIPESTDDNEAFLQMQSQVSKYLKTIANDEERLKERLNNYLRYGSTTRSLETLISFYESACSNKKTYLGIDVGEFNYRLYKLFNRVENTRTIIESLKKENTQQEIKKFEKFSIFFGGARIYKSKTITGQGFAIKFIDGMNDPNIKYQKEDEKPPILLFVNENQLNSSPKKAKRILQLLEDYKTLKEINKSKGKKPYFKVYFIGKISRSKKGDTYVCHYSDLKNLHMRVFVRK